MWPQQWCEDPFVLACVGIVPCDIHKSVDAYGVKMVEGAVWWVPLVRREVRVDGGLKGVGRPGAPTGQGEVCEGEPVNQALSPKRGTMVLSGVKRDRRVGLGTETGVADASVEEPMNAVASSRFASKASCDNR